MKFLRNVVVVAVVVVGSFGSVATAGAITRGLDHQGFGLELERVCSAAETQFAGAAALNDSDADAALYQYLKDNVRVITNLEAKLKALKATDSADAKVLKDLLALLARERLFLNRMAVQAKAKHYDRVRRQLATEGDKFSELELAISNRLLRSGLSGCSVLTQPDDAGPDLPEPSTTVPGGPIPSTVPAAPADDLLRFFPSVTGYTWVRPSESQEKILARVLVDSPELLSIAGRTIVGPDSRIFGSFSVVKTKPGVIDQTFKSQYLDQSFPSRAKREKLPAVGMFAEIYSGTIYPGTADALDALVAFQGDYVLELLTVTTSNRQGSKDFGNAVLNALSATGATTAAVPTTGPPPTTVPPTTVPPTTVPGAPVDPNASTTTVVASTVTSTTVTATTTSPTTLAPKQV
jgi:hypothetical protein